VDLFEYQAQDTTRSQRPLAERMRPETLDEVAGQDQVVGPGQLIRRAIESDRIFSMILWGPPGCGKTTLARIVARETRSYFAQFSAVLSGVKEIRAVVDAAREQLRGRRRRTIVFVDEIHRFNKAQQDAFLHHVEEGLVTLIGATTENPSFEVIAPLLSRCRVIPLKALSAEAIAQILTRAVADEHRGLGLMHLDVDPEALAHLAHLADGDARRGLNLLEIVASLLPDAPAQGPRHIGLPAIDAALRQTSLRYDKSGDAHYNLISAFHKSLRGSDPDAALYWLQRMLSAGEDPLYAARRMVRFASEDVGNADPMALTVALNATETYRLLGSPEGELALGQAAAYLATAPKSNSVYVACNAVKAAVAQTGTLEVPLHIRNAPTGLMRQLGYGKGYRYAHDYREGYVPQDYLPDALKATVFYRPSDRGYEKLIKQRLERWRALKRKGATPAA
jgi:putative ATPase